MGRPKIARKSTNIDMTAMCDVAFLLLSFFILTTKFKPAEAITVVTPNSVSSKPAPEKDFVLVTIDKDGKVFFSMDDETKNLIQSHIDNNEVCLFMKGTPDAPQCGFSMAVSNMLKILEVNYKGINVLESQPLREGIKEFSDWPTIPQVYIKGEFIGGCDIVKEMYENGELKKILETKEINFKN